MSTYPLVSIIITTKNEEQNIVKCLKSISKASLRVKKQNYKGNIETILVDNHSTDNTVKYARKYTSKIVIAGNERSEQRNIGAKLAKGTWLLFLDADMQLESGVVSECINKVLNQSNSMVAILQIYRGFNFWGKALALEQNCYGEDINFLTAARFFRKADFLKVKGFNTRLLAGEDWDLTQRLAKKGVKILHLKSQVIYHNESKLSLFELLKKEAYYIKFMDRYAKKHPAEFAKQSSISYRIKIWIKSWKKLITHPILTLAFLFYKGVVWLMWFYHTQISHK